MADPAASAAAPAFSFATLSRRFSTAARHGDVFLAIGVITILVVLILPLPRFLLDVCLAFSITLSVLILLTALFIEKPLEFNAFPTVLLLSTMVRLALNLASTRLILTHGHEGPDAAGHVIEAFGGFIMGGNFVIGVIVFAILMIVNFIVITKGSTRIAEVSARFTLDAMPGKQMAIDADLSAGLIDEDQARERRRTLEQESTFFGAMDGSSKFVRGDAVAGLLIIAINIVGGIIIGVGQQGMSFGNAAGAFTRLTIGDGLVTQIPALIVSTAAGVVITKAGLPGRTEKALSSQLAGSPKALAMSAVLLLALGLLPGIPAAPFLLLASIVGGIAYAIHRRSRMAALADDSARAAEPAAEPEEPIASTLRLDDIRLELGYGLLPLVNAPSSGMRLTDQIRGLRRQLAAEFGFVMPSVRIQDNVRLGPQVYALYIKEIEAGRGEVRPDRLLAMDPRGEEISIAGEKTREPTFGLPALWIDPTQREDATFRGLTVVDPVTVVITHLTETIKEHMPDILSYAETRKLLDELDKPHQKLISDLVPGQVSYATLQRVLQNLLAERVSIRDLPTILEGVAEAGGRTIAGVTEHVRARLSRQLCDMHANSQGVVPLLSLSPEWEQTLAESLSGSGEDRQLALSPSKIQEFAATVRSAFERQAQAGESPVLLTSAAVRPYVRSLMERFRPLTTVLSQNEIHPKARIRAVGQV